MKPLTLCLSLLLCSTLFSASSFAEVYKWVDADGKTHFGDDKDAQTTAAAKKSNPVVVELKKANAYEETKPTPEEVRQELIKREKAKPENKKFEDKDTPR